MEEQYMKSKWLLGGVIIVCISCLAACKKEKPLSPIPDSLANLQELLNPTYQISTDSIHQMIQSYLNENKQATPWDSALAAHYREKDEFFWLLYKRQTPCCIGWRISRSMALIRIFILRIAFVKNCIRYGHCNCSRERLWTDCWQILNISWRLPIFHMYVS